MFPLTLLTWSEAADLDAWHFYAYFGVPDKELKTSEPWKKKKNVAISLQNRDFPFYYKPTVFELDPVFRGQITPLDIYHFHLMLTLYNHAYVPK